MQSYENIYHGAVGWGWGGGTINQECLHTPHHAETEHASNANATLTIFALDR